MHPSIPLRVLRTSIGAVAVAWIAAACAEPPTTPAPDGLSLFKGARASAVFSGRLFAVDGASGNPATLYQLNKATGAVIAVVGPTGFGHVAAIDFDPMTGVLYGIDNNSDQLLTLNTTTGAGTVVATITWVGGVGCHNNVPDMSFDSQGNLYAWREPCDDDLYRIDKVTGVATAVGNSGVGTARVGLAFDSNDQLYMKSFADVWRIDTNTGAATFVVGIPAFETSNIAAFDENDVLYTGRRGGGSPLMTLDLNTGALTVVGNTGIPQLSAIAFERIANQAPVCTGALPSVAELWPPNHEMVDVNVNGVTDPDGDAVSITITAIMQDEPVNGLGDGDTSPDGAGVGTSTAQVRAERSGTGDGRVYVISFTASDGRGGTCTGSVTVSVRHSQGNGKGGGPAVNSGATFDSTN